MIYLNPLSECGFDILPPVLNNEQIKALLKDIENAMSESGETHAIRNLFQRVPSIAELARSTQVRSMFEPYLGENCFAVRAIYFDKLPVANWKVPWHQDLSIAVKQKLDVDGFGPWSQKDGVAHVQPPVEILENMLTVRLHMDSCHRNNGPLRVLLGTHRLGKFSADQIENLRAEIPETICELELGGALLMRPLLLHASSAAESPGHRRVIHIEYANVELPGGLDWQEVIN